MTCFWHFLEISLSSLKQCKIKHTAPENSKKKLSFKTQKEINDLKLDIRGSVSLHTAEYLALWEHYSHQPRVMLDHRWLPALNRAPPGERERGDECRELQREQTLRRDGSPSRKNISAPQLMTAELPLPPSPPSYIQSREDS